MCKKNYMNLERQSDMWLSFPGMCTISKSKLSSNNSQRRNLSFAFECLLR